ncbi:hypothetical protein [Thalassospira sp.]|uniref:hypothetical protein n=1 Tax=Thalassospira sp. TaxID=1912094 RepID=UPI00262C01D8|nr:hypothetical protein [Thalassospira sp.]MCH2277004.1 hypothetical protein [Thalassospira sp.]
MKIKKEEFSIDEKIRSTHDTTHLALTSAHMFANDGIKSLILLNGGTFVALPALKGLSSDVNITTLYPAVICFMIGITCALLAMLFAYISLYSASHGFSASAEYWENYKLAISDPDNSIEHKETIKNISKLIFTFTKLMKSSEILSSIFAISSLITFVMGGYLGIEAFYPNIKN